MTKEQADILAEEISQQFSHVETLVLQSSDERNAPHNWFITVSRRGDDPEAASLFIHSRYQWSEALSALHILQDEVNG
jgi:hypothetical protein